MRREAFRAALVVGVLVPLGVIGVATTQPSVRALARSFVTPLSSAASPPPAPEVSALPPELGPTGAESIELRALRAAEEDAGAPPARAPRTALFPTPVVSAPIERWVGLQRPSIARREDTGIDRAMAYLAQDEHGHRALLAAVRRLGPRRAEVEQIARAWKVPEELIAIALVESGFSPAATATDGRAGLWSLTRGVAGAYQLALLEQYDERRAVALSTEAAAHYLADLRERFGSWDLAVLAFGTGYSKTLRLLSNRAVDFGTIAATLPPEDATYVEEVLATATALANPDRFGLDAAGAGAPLTTSDLEVPGGMPFSTLARAAGTSVETLRDLNPEYLGNTVPATGFAMVMHLPSTTLARAKESLMPMLYATSGSALNRPALPRESHDAGGSAPGPAEAATTRAGGRRVFYHPREGETLDAIAARFGIARETVASDNALDPTAPLRAGQLLVLRLGAPGSGSKDAH